MNAQEFIDTARVLVVGDNATGAFAKETPGLAIRDISMPPANGDRSDRRVGRSRANRSGVPIDVIDGRASKAAA